MKTFALRTLALLALLSPFALAETIKCMSSSGCEMRIYQDDGTLGEPIEAPRGTIIDSSRAVAWGEGWSTQ